VAQRVREAGIHTYTTCYIFFFVCCCCGECPSCRSAFSFSLFLFNSLPVLLQSRVPSIDQQRRPRNETRVFTRHERHGGCYFRRRAHSVLNHVACQLGNHIIHALALVGKEGGREEGRVGGGTVRLMAKRLPLLSPYPPSFLPPSLLYLAISMPFRRVRQNRAGTYRIHPYAISTTINRRAPRQGKSGGLGGAVGTHACLAHKGRNRTEVHNRAARCSKEGGREGRKKVEEGSASEQSIEHFPSPFPPSFSNQDVQASLALPLLLFAFITRIACFDARPYPLILLPVTTSQSVSVASSALEGRGGREGGKKEGGRVNRNRSVINQ